MGLSFSAVSASTVSGKPLRVATLSMSADAKSSSPRIALSVMSLTSSLVPARSAKRSIASSSMRVESTSKTTRNRATNYSSQLGIAGIGWMPLRALRS